MNMSVNKLLGFFAAAAILVGCNLLSSPKDQELIHYKVNLTQVNLTTADSVTIDYWVNGKTTPIHAVKAPVTQKTAVFDIQVEKGTQLTVRVRVYNGGVIVSDRVDPFVAGDVGASPNLVPVQVATVHVVSIHDSLDLMAPYAALGISKCTFSGSAVPVDGGNCRLVFPDTGSFNLALHFSDSSGHSMEERVFVRTIRGLPRVEAGENDTDASARMPISFHGVATDSNIEGQWSAMPGTIASYRWDFNGDGVVDQSSTVDSTFTWIYSDLSPDSTYSARFCVTDNSANEVCATRSVRVRNHPPINLNINASKAIVPLSTNTILQIYSDAVSDPDGNMVDSIAWTFSDSTPTRKVGITDTIQLLREHPDTIVATATVVDRYGSSATDSIKLMFWGGYTGVTSAEPRLAGAGSNLLLNPIVRFQQNQVIAICEWSIGGSAFQAVGNTCDTTISLPSQLGPYAAVFRATSNRLTVFTDTIMINVGEGLTDSRDNQCYPVINLGSQKWMAQNLNYSGDDGAGGRAYSVGWCYGSTDHQDGDGCANGYGRLYQWTDAMALDSSYLLVQTPAGTIQTKHRGICPSGWHLPDTSEWSALAAHVRSSQGVSAGAEGQFLKALLTVDTLSWNSATYNAKDLLGFSGLPAGQKDTLGYTGVMRFEFRGQYSLYWTATESFDVNAYYESLLGSNARLSRSMYKKGYGYSVRCVKD